MSSLILGGRLIDDVEPVSSIGGTKNGNIQHKTLWTIQGERKAEGLLQAEGDSGHIRCRDELGLSAILELDSEALGELVY